MSPLRLYSAGRTADPPVVITPPVEGTKHGRIQYEVNLLVFHACDKDETARRLANESFSIVHDCDEMK